ncbi:MAG: DUF3987 domain-containing protein, partial [Deltaproteobacteria bacterium]
MAPALLLDAALRLASLGYRVFPLTPGSKVPLPGSCGVHDATTDPNKIRMWWTEHPDANIGLACGDGLLALDVDPGAIAAYGAQEVAALELDWIDRPRSRTPRGGFHLFMRAPDGVTLRNSAGRLGAGLDLKTAGGYVVAPPSHVADAAKGIDGAYEWVEPLECPPEALPECPSWLAERLREIDGAQRLDIAGINDGLIPEGRRNDALASIAGHLRSIGLDAPAIAAALREVNAQRCSPPLEIREVHRIAASIARYEPRADLAAPSEPAFLQTAHQDPGPLPDGLLSVPGFIDELTDASLRDAPYPNRTMAFAGALALQALLAGRKVRDPGDNRTNLYVLALAHSSAGKDIPRKMNAAVLRAVGLSGCLAQQLASGEGVQDALAATPALLVQTDEIDTLLQSIRHAREARFESLMATLLTMYSSANSVYPMRRRANNPDPGVIDQPCLVVFGTAIPNHYYAALSERMLTNGLFARMLILEAGPRGAGQEPSIPEPPPRVLDTAAWWANFRPEPGNLTGEHPRP